MIDYFALALTHGLLALACWRILLRGDLDREVPVQLPEEEAPARAARPVMKVGRTDA